MMPGSLREDNGGVLPPLGAEDILPPNQSGWRQRIRPTQYTIANNLQNLPRRFVETCLNTELDTITLRGKKANGAAVEKVMDYSLRWSMGHRTSSPLILRMMEMTTGKRKSSYVVKGDDRM
ncbi:hypothetical protein RIF29_22067 [Crotalaria pallida]|uniref:Uncharacterized protein n=1 Tax=Crotalaria pallida TaxID=3830 RepID=A0AAN9F3Q1_CROPI